MDDETNETKVHNFMHFLEIPLKIVGCWDWYEKPTKEYHIFINNLYLGMVLFVLANLPLSLIVHLYTEWIDIMSSLDKMADGLPLLASVAIVSYFALYKHELYELVRFMNENFKWHSARGLTNMTMLRSYQMARNFAYFYTACTVFSVAMYVFLPVLTHLWTKQPLQPWIYMDVTRTPFIVIVFLRQCIAQAFVALSLGQLSVFFAVNSILLCGQLDLLCCSLHNVRYTALLQQGVCHQAIVARKYCIQDDERHSYLYNQAQMTDSEYHYDTKVTTSVNKKMHFDIYSAKYNSATEAALRECARVLQASYAYKQRFERFVSPLLVLRVVQVTLYLCTLLYAATLIEHKICEQFPEDPYIGVFYGTEPTLIVKDPGHIGFITNKEFNSFNSREISKYCHKEVITESLFFTHGQKWKSSRQTLSPVFTSLSLKNMFHIIEKCALDLDKMLHVEVGISSTVNVRRLMANYTMDCICSCVLGVNANTMDTTDSVNPFRIMVYKLFESSPLGNFLYTIRSMWPAVFYGLRLKVFSLNINGFFLKLYKDICESRQYKPSSRNDIVDYLMIDRKSDEEITGYLVILFGAGYETSANTLSITLYELAKNEEVQKRARKEVDEYLLRTKIKYECVNELSYLYACVNETMRLNPVLGVITREVMQDCTLPTGLQLEKGIRIHIPAYHITRHPDYFSDPDQYKPERFLNETIKPFTFMPFGEGPRQCIGKRFAKMQVLPCLVTILKYYRLELPEDMPKTLEFEVATKIAQLKGPILVKFIPRQENA